MGQETEKDEARIKDHLGEMVRETIKEALIEMYLDGVVMSRSRADEVRNDSLLLTSAVNAEGFRDILKICEGRMRASLAGRRS